MGLCVCVSKMLSNKDKKKTGTTQHWNMAITLVILARAGFFSYFSCTQVSSVGRGEEVVEVVV